MTNDGYCVERNRHGYRMGLSCSKFRVFENTLYHETGECLRLHEGNPLKMFVQGSRCTKNILPKRIVKRNSVLYRYIADSSSGSFVYSTSENINNVRLVPSDFGWRDKKGIY